MLQHVERSEPPAQAREARPIGGHDAMQVAITSAAVKGLDPRFKLARRDNNEHGRDELCSRCNEHERTSSK